MARRVFGRSLAVLVVLTGAACRGEGQGGEARLLPPAEATRQVSDLLYRRNLIADPEVNARMNEYVLQVSRDGRSADAVMPEFQRWLASWARDHPDRVAAARLAPAADTTWAELRPSSILYLVRQLVRAGRNGEGAAL